MNEIARMKPQWLSESLRSLQLIQPPFVQRYEGQRHPELESQYASAFNDATLESCAAAGVKSVWTRFFSGYGLEHEKPEMEHQRDFYRRAHARGMKTIAMVSLGALVPELLLSEESDAQNWLQVTAQGQHAFIGKNAFRQRPCYNSEAFLRYMERVATQAVEFGADGVFFMHLGYNAEPDACRCAICVAAFREFLRTKYGVQDEKTRQAGKEVFGHSNFTHVRPPLFTAANLERAGAPVTPHEIEWIAFKAHSIANCVERLARGIRKHNAACAVGADLLRSGGRGAAQFGIDYALQVPHLDFIAPSEGAYTLWQDEQSLTREYGVSVLVHSQTEDGRKELAIGDWPLPLFELRCIQQ